MIQLRCPLLKKGFSFRRSCVCSDYNIENASDSHVNMNRNELSRTFCFVRRFLPAFLDNVGFVSAYSIWLVGNTSKTNGVAYVSIRSSR